MIDVARHKTAEMGVLRNSILMGSGSIAGFIGEQLAHSCLGGVIENTYEYDIIMGDGTLVDVKTKQTSFTPLPYYDCSIANYNTKQKCDAYAFVRIKRDFTIGWYLGIIRKEEYFNRATFYKKGEVDPSNNYTVKADCYNLDIAALEEHLVHA